MKETASKKKFSSRATFIVIIIIAVAVASVSVILFRTLAKYLVDSVTETISLQYSRELNAQMSAHISSTLDHYFYDLGIEHNALSLVDDLDETKLKQFIGNAQSQNDISYLAFADEDGYVYEADGSYLGTMRISMLGKLLNGSAKLIEDNETVGNESYIMLGTSFEEPVRMGDKKISIAIMGVTNDALAERIVLDSNYSGGYSSIIHTDGSYIIKNPAEPYGGLNAFSILSKNGLITENTLKALSEEVLHGGEYLVTTGSTTGNAGEDGEDSAYLYFAPIEGTDWYAVNTLPSSFIRSSVMSVRDGLASVSAIIAVIGLIVAAAVVVTLIFSADKLEKSQAALEKALQAAEKASKAKTDFLFNMSHDIRTPMNAILGYTDIGLRNVDNRAQSEDSYRKIRSAGEHLLNLINDILEMSRIEAGKMVLTEKPLDIRQAVAGVTNMSQSLADTKGVGFETVIGEIQNPCIYADELHINEVIINLISNAVKYTPEGGKVRYSISQVDNTADGRATFRFEIADNGIGMSEEFQEHLFEAFSREKTTTVSRIEGTGLGLSIVKKIVDMVGGEIRVKSVQGEGSTFTVDIPFQVMEESAAKELMAEEDTEDSFGEDPVLVGKKVLLVEDNEMNREIADYILEDAGLDVENAEDGSVALQAVQEKGVHYYDYILMDIQMPVMDGYEATKAIRALPEGDLVPIIALSANAFEEDKKKSLAEGMNAHVAKPIDIKELFTAMHALMK